MFEGISSKYICLLLFILNSGVPRLWKPKANTRTLQAFTQRGGGQQETLSHLQS